MIARAKKEPTIFLAVGFLFLISIGLNTPVALACKCADPQAPATELQNAVAVFAGKATSTRIAPASNVGTDTSLYEQSTLRIVTFAVERTWKGDSSTTATVLTQAYSPACGFEFQQDEEYLVYAYEQADDIAAEFSTDLCTRTRLLADANEDLVALGPGEVPPTPPADNCRPSTPAEGLQQASAVFAGTAIDTGIEEDVQKTMFNVSRAWKGIVEKTVFVSASYTVPGLIFHNDEEYLVYVFSDSTSRFDHFTTSPCTRTRLLADADEDLVALGPGTIIMHPGALPELPEGPLPSWNWRIGSLAIIVATLAVSAHKIRVRKKRGKRIWWIILLALFPALFGIALVIGSW